MKIRYFLSLLALLCSGDIFSVWYRQETAIVYREVSPAESIATGMVGLGACVGMGIASIVKHKAKKRQFKEYQQAFKDMGYSREQAMIYAKMAMNNPEGLQAVVRSIDQEKLSLSKMAAEQKTVKMSHEQKMQEMSHEYKLKLLTYLVMLLASIIAVGTIFLCYRSRKNK